VVTSTPELSNEIGLTDSPTSGIQSDHLSRVSCYVLLRLHRILSVQCGSNLVLSPLSSGLRSGLRSGLGRPTSLTSLIVMVEEVDDAKEK
jgi:hypothetical protein